MRGKIVELTLPWRTGAEATRESREHWRTSGTSCRPRRFGKSRNSPGSTLAPARSTVEVCTKRGFATRCVLIVINLATLNVEIASITTVTREESLSEEDTQSTLNGVLDTNPVGRYSPRLPLITSISKRVLVSVRIPDSMRTVILTVEGICKRG